AARDGGGSILGYACLYWHFSSTRAVETVLMNDLFVAPEARGRGIGRALIEASAAVARERGLARVGHGAGQSHRPAPLRLDDEREIDLARVRAGHLSERREQVGSVARDDGPIADLRFERELSPRPTPGPRAGT